jgi:glycosyltransferase involved in cell wall biosynthesis
MKKILFYFGGFASVGGIETFCKNLLDYLKMKEFDCTILCWGADSPLLEFLKQRKISIVCSPWRWGCRWNLPDRILLPLGIQQIKRADIVLFGKLFPLKILQKLRSRAASQTRFVYITPYKPMPPPNSLEKLKILDSLNCFDRILVQAQDFKYDLQEIGYQKSIDVIPYITERYNSPQALPDMSEIKIGFLGRLVEDKNLPLLLESFKQFCQKYAKPSSLYIFGEGHLRRSLEQQSEELGLNGSVYFHGNIPNREIQKAISSCHLFAFSSSLEGQCLAALEILAGGRPIVATDVGAFSDILSDARLGELVVNATSNQFSEGLLKIAQAIGNRTISPETIYSAYLERYDPQVIGDRYVRVLSSL